ncbi:hypothetical protein DL96DRAFT_1639682 [Flagelloscypha sp. PMI_526]|nr:hypothetical protein DL96DRAFT_1639682 [Flagelloscypha sp. PMI_526]
MVYPRLPVELLSSIPKILALDNDNDDPRALICSLSLVNKIFLVPCQKVLFRLIKLSADDLFDSDALEERDVKERALFEKFLFLLRGSPHIGTYTEELQISIRFLLRPLDESSSDLQASRLFPALSSLHFIEFCGLEPDLKTLTGREEHDGLTGPTPWVALPVTLRRQLEQEVFPRVIGLDLLALSGVPFSVLLPLRGNLKFFLCTNDVVMDIPTGNTDAVPPEEEHCVLECLTVWIWSNIAKLNGVEGEAVYEAICLMLEGVFAGSHLHTLKVHAPEVDYEEGSTVALGRLLKMYKATLRNVSLDVFSSLSEMLEDDDSWIRRWSNPLFDFSSYPLLSRFEFKTDCDPSLRFVNAILSLLKGSTTLKEVALTLSLNSTFIGIPSLDSLFIDLSGILDDHFKEEEDEQKEIQDRFDGFADFVTFCLPHFTGERPDVYFTHEEPSF